MDSIILASASPRRKDLLRQIGIDFEVIPSQCEESISSNIPKEVVQQLAKQKAEDVVLRIREAGKIVLGADTVVAYGDQILGKPADKEDAYRMIGLLQGKEHQVYTGVCLSYLTGEGRIVSHDFYEETSVFVWPMSEEEIVKYIEDDFSEWQDKAGAYGIQGRFAAFIQKIHGDYNNVVGLPVGRVYQQLKEILKSK